MAKAEAVEEKPQEEPAGLFAVGSPEEAATRIDELRALITQKEKDLEAGQQEIGQLRNEVELLNAMRVHAGHPAY